MSSRATLLFVLALVVATARPAAQRATAQTIAVAAASDLQAVLPALMADFKKTTGIAATVSFGSSGNFFAQIQNGAPFDVFFSADVDYPRRLVGAGQADRGSLYEYATGRLVLWARNDSGLDMSKGLDVVRSARVRRIAVANPDFAPYGRAAIAALKSRGLYESVRDKLVFGENISQTAQLAESGNADVGLLAHSLAVDAALRQRGTFVDLPASAYPAVVQAMVIVSSSHHAAAARALLGYMKGPHARKTLDDFGFGPPPPR